MRNLSCVVGILGLASMIVACGGSGLPTDDLQSGTDSPADDLQTGRDTPTSDLYPGRDFSTIDFYPGGEISEMSVVLNVEDFSPDGMPRKDEPVTSGVPIPQSVGIYNKDHFVLTDSLGTPLPAQFKVLSRWNGQPNEETKPIKWLLVDFQANVQPGETAQYTLTTGQRTLPEVQIDITDNESKIVVDTGSAIFEINRNYFNLFDRVTVKNNSTLLVDQAGKGGITLIDGKGKEFSTLLSAPEDITIEESGPLHSVINIRGVFKAKDGSFFAPSIKDYGDDPKWPRYKQPYPNSFFYYNCRMHFYAGKSYVKVFLTIENNGSNGRTNPEQNYAPIQMVTFDRIGLNLNLLEQPSTRFISNDLDVPLTKNDHLTIFQNWKENSDPSRSTLLEPSFVNGPYYDATLNGEGKQHGQLHPGWMRIAGENGGVGLYMRHFWQNYPKKLGGTPATMTIDLWPAEGYYPYARSESFPEREWDDYLRKAGKHAGLYLFDAGRHKTHEFILDFAKSGDQGASSSMLSTLSYPLMALAPANWFVESGALGLIAPGGLSNEAEPEVNEAMQRFDQLQLAMVDEEVAQNGWTINNLKTAVEPHWNYPPQWKYFGWMNFGDMLWEGQVPSSLHYDWPYSMLLHYVRTGERKLFDTAVEMVKHRYDVDQYHGDRTDKQGNHVYINGMSFYEIDGHADPSVCMNNPSRISMNSHTWNGGLVLYYLLTGDQKAWEAAVENGIAASALLAKLSETLSCADAELRQETWPILNLVNLYRADGNPEYLRVAKNIAVNRVLYREQEVGKRGNFGRQTCDLQAGKSEASVMLAYSIDPLIQIHHETQDPQIASLIVRMAEYTKNMFLFGGDTNDEGQYRPLQSLFIWYEDRPNEGKGEPVKNLFWADLFSYAFRITKESKYLEWARQAFRDGMFYYTMLGGTYVDPSSRARIGFIDGGFPNSESKVHGWMGRTNQVYLNTEYELLKAASE